MRPPGDHILLIYEDTPELVTFVASFIEEGLSAGQRCLCAPYAPELPDITRALAARGIDVERECRRGALVFMDAATFAGPPPFDPRRMVELLHNRVMDSEVRGFGGLRVAADATWTASAGVSPPALSEYELLVERAVDSGRLTVACMSRRDRFDQCNLQQLVHTHAKVIANDCVYLSLSTFLQGLAREDLQELAQSARARRAPKGEFLFHQGQPAPEVYMLTSGAVKIVRVDGDGRSVVLRLVKLMEPFAERGFLGGTTRLASAQALEDSRALVWDAPVIDEIIVRNPVVALNNIRMLAEMVETERKRLEDFAGPSVERRLARLLMRLAQSIGHRADGGLALEISLSRQDLAELVITTPFTISRILADWRRLDIADALGERIVIRSPQRMAAIADMHIAEDLAELREGNRALER